MVPAGRRAPADLAENSPVRGCMVIKPWGYALWENIQRALDRMFKATGHVNAYFPLFIPLSFLEKEAAHVEGFAKECAVVTHHRLEAGPDGGLVPAGELEEPLIVRPTSETIIGATFAKWVQSYRDLPILINQWANVVRWEMRTRLFLRTAEFLWQEGHTAHATEAEAREETMRMLDVYADVRAATSWRCRSSRARRRAGERFPGAVDTYCIEAMMQDRKALQAGTSHFLGQNFAQGVAASSSRRKEGREELAWTTSWGVSTRLIGALIMTHARRRRARPAAEACPEARRSAPDLSKRHRSRACARALRRAREGAPRAALRRRACRGRDRRPRNDRGEKIWYHVKRGVPLRLEIGPRDIDAGVVSLTRRDRGPKERTAVPRAEIVARIGELLGEIQRGLLERAEKFQKEHTREITEPGRASRVVSTEERRQAGDPRRIRAGPVR